MTDCPANDWDLRADEVQRDQLAAYDRLRESHGVAYGEMLQWSVFRHADALSIVQDHERFSSVVSRHVAVPNGMDPPEHTAYRHLINPYFTPERVAALVPECEHIADELLGALQRTYADIPNDFILTCALPYAARVQCAFLGWPQSLEGELSAWIARHHRASFAQEHTTLATLGLRFEALVDRMLDERQVSGSATPVDATQALMRETVDGRPLARSAIASILRNWTVGEIGTIAASVGIVAEWLARHPDLQQRLRGEPGLQAEAIEEMLRLHGPLVVNRRVTTCPVQVGGRAIAQGERVTVHWTSANRDPRVFEAPEEFRFGRNHGNNLLYGAGIHVCPGASLARAELAVLLRALLQCTQTFGIAPGEEPALARYPAMGFASLPLVMGWAAQSP